ncbi:MAG: MBL fold metallo-hydrolase [Salibacteraceae bacterium]|jgi:hydroxyacylglutathione hydrolase|nr:MBL fold metallo-hydrolase [Salibacteraceae bacterium]MDP4685455.1 MBL fold metallo-hydrolase [Salibacteraceae bacterium]MDP4764699.1 MBL fold metallo-hydrolase [Salibacteraceae bacterium]MDP4965829.1 MBL fold metallo-hydrolase [Salibacteraceae bacterium]
MISIKKFVFSPFQENTYIVYNQHKNAIVVDPGCYENQEKEALKSFIKTEGLTVKKLINTHCHLDHVFGNRFVCDSYQVLPEYHKLDEPTMKMAPISASMYGIPGFEESPKCEEYLMENTVLSLDEDEFELRFCPGHAPGHLVLVNHSQKLVIGGDVLFRASIGRTDLPGGNHQSLIDSIKSQLFTLSDDFLVYSGHGPETTIGYEKENNPFLN